jgi:endoglucanase
MRFVAALLAALCLPQAFAAEGETFVRVNQVGYHPAAPKLAIALSRADLAPIFAVADAETRQVVFEGRTRPVEGRWAAFTRHADLDLSALQTPGRYVVRLGTTESLPFTIVDAAYAKLPDQMLEFMRQQRCGYNPWLDAVCHPFDGRTAYGPRAAGSHLNATGGWHDAADQLKYLLTSSNATAQLLLAYRLEQERGGGESRKSIFADALNDLGQPEPNGIPDVLDEAKWGLDWMLKLHPAPDELYHQVADDRDHIGWRLPHKEIADYGWGPGGPRVVYFADGQPQGLGRYRSTADGVANLAGRYAAAMALGHQVWKDDPRLRPYAESLLTAGREVYALGRAKEGAQQGNSFSAPYRYEETTWADDMEWGAAELFRATGEASYLEEAKRYAELAASESWMGRHQARHYQFYPFFNAGHFRLYDLVDNDFQAILAGYYREGIEHCVKAAEGNPYGTGVPFLWCSNNLVTALATQCLLYERMTADSRYHGFAAKQRDWLLGRNPWGVSMITDVPAGGTFPRDPHLFPNVLLKRKVRGGLVDGPVHGEIFRSLKGVGITQPDPLAAFHDDRAVYHDDVKDYSTNEPTMDGTASAILLWAVAAGATE